MTYKCPVCGSGNPNAYLECNHPGCTDGRDPRDPVGSNPWNSSGDESGRPWVQTAGSIENEAWLLMSRLEDLNQMLFITEQSRDKWATLACGTWLIITCVGIWFWVL